MAIFDTMEWVELFPPYMLIKNSETRLSQLLAVKLQMCPHSSRLHFRKYWGRRNLQPRWWYWRTRWGQRRWRNKRKRSETCGSWRGAWENVPNHDPGRSTPAWPQAPRDGQPLWISTQTFKRTWRRLPRSKETLQCSPSTHRQPNDHPCMDPLDPNTAILSLQCFSV